MPDFRNFDKAPLPAGTLTRPDNSTVSVPRFRITGAIHDSQNGRQLADFTGARAFTFPDDLSAGYLTAADKREFVELIAGWVLERRRQRGG